LDGSLVEEVQKSREGRDEGRSRVDVTSSGHIAGLQNATAFGAREREIRNANGTDFSNNDPSLTGQQAETTYRDKRGRKLDMLNEFMRQQAIREGKEVKLNKAQYEWGKGIVQKEDVEEKQRELQYLASAPFARTIDDERLEVERKMKIRDGDPMAAYLSKLTNGNTSDSGNARESVTRSGKPLYRGPVPPPNRFGIRPGYRWDAVDRGNGFEHKLLTLHNSKNSLREDEYRWSVADM
jgi:pre-mRNA-splicing factor CWC26